MHQQPIPVSYQPNVGNFNLPVETSRTNLVPYVGKPNYQGQWNGHSDRNFPNNAGGAVNKSSSSHFIPKITSAVNNRMLPAMHSRGVDYALANQQSADRKRKSGDSEEISNKRVALNDDGPLRYNCSYCKRSFKKYTGLEAHITIVHSSAGLTTTSASQVSSPLPVVENIVETTAIAKNLLCPHCKVKKSFKTEMSLQQHISASHLDVFSSPITTAPTGQVSTKPAEIFQCAFCDKKLHSYSSLQQHIAAKHEATKKQEHHKDDPGDSVIALQTASSAEMDDDNTAREMHTLEGDEDEIEATLDQNIRERRLDQAIADVERYQSPQLFTIDPKPQVIIAEDFPVEVVPIIGTLAIEEKQPGDTSQGVIVANSYGVEKEETAEATADSAGNTLTTSTVTTDSISSKGKNHGELQCTICNRRCKFQFSLQQHYVNRHGVVAPVAKSIPEGNSSENAQEKIDAPVTIPNNDAKSPESVIRCHICLKKVKNGLGLQQHLAMKHVAT